jgi:hypothetical protein
VESFGKCWKIGVANIGEKIMGNDLSYLNYNLKLKMKHNQFIKDKN